MKKNIKIIFLITLSLVFLTVISFLVWYTKDINKTVTVITLDINPSIKISLNKNDKVLKVEPLNNDSEKLLKDAKIKNTSMENAFKKISDLLIEEKNITGSKNTILVNVQGKNVENQVSSIISDSFKERKIECNIIIQKSSNTSLDNSKKYGITEGKASYIEDIIKENKDLTFELLKDKSIDEINDFLIQREENRKKVEEQKRLEEEKKKQAEEQKRLEEEKRKQEEKKKQESSTNAPQPSKYNPEEELNKLLQQYSENQAEINKIISNLKIVGIGDSVMLGAVNNLQSLFPNGHFDAKVSRSIKSTKDIIVSLNNSGSLGEPLIISAGSNGDCSESIKNTIMQEAGNREVFWLTVTNDSKVHFNSKIKNYASRYNNLHIIDWESISSGHKEYFYNDGIHLTPKGRKAYADVVYNAVYQVYAKKIDDKLQEQKKAQEEQTKQEELEENKKEEKVK